MNRMGIPVFLWGSALGLLLAVVFHAASYIAGGYITLAGFVAALFVLTIALPVAILAGGLWLWRRWAIAQRIARWSAAIVLITGVQAGGAIAIWLLTTEDRVDSMIICDQLIPQLETYRSAQGSYPKTLRALDEFSALSTPIETIEASECSYYSADGTTFRLTVNEFWTSYWDYDSETQQWEYFD
ncbi:MAG: hypothetical protein AAF152_04160 [Cyanobacteria bacterium P01_A01_bin.114]